MTITAYQDGPYLVRGPFRMLDQEGRQIVMQRRTVALCRCGKSQLRPLCDGTHRSIGFRAPSAAESQARAEPLPEGFLVAQTLDSSNGDSGADGQPRLLRKGSRIYVKEPASPCDDRVALLESVRGAELCLTQSLGRHCSAGDYAAMSLAEPLLSAARRLLEWGGGDAASSLISSRPNGHRPGSISRSSSQELVTRAIARARRLEPHEDPRLRQVRSLLADAARALGS